MQNTVDFLRFFVTCATTTMTTRIAGPFIPWSGEDTFRDSFGYRYEYEAAVGRSKVVSLGLERAKSRAAEAGVHSH